MDKPELALSVMKLSMEWVCQSTSSAWHPPTSLTLYILILPSPAAYHLVAQNREFVELQEALILAVDGLVGKQPSSGDHIGGHAVTFSNVSKRVYCWGASSKVTHR